MLVPFARGRGRRAAHVNLDGSPFISVCVFVRAPSIPCRCLGKAVLGGESSSSTRLQNYRKKVTVGGRWFGLSNRGISAS